MVNQSNLNLLVLVLEQLGVFWWFLHHRNRQKLPVKKTEYLETKLRLSSTKIFKRQFILTFLPFDKIITSEIGLLLVPFSCQWNKLAKIGNSVRWSRAEGELEMATGIFPQIWISNTLRILNFGWDLRMNSIYSLFILVYFVDKWKQKFCRGFQNLPFDQIKGMIHYE